MTSIAIVTMFRNPVIADLLEWIAYHKVIGVSRFILYDHGHPAGRSWNVEQTRSALEPYLNDGSVELRLEVKTTLWRHPQNYYGSSSRGSSGQFDRKTAFIDGLESEHRNSEWIAFIDYDEFIHLPRGDDLQDYLTVVGRDARIGSLLIQMRCYGASGHDQRPAGLVTSNYTWRERDFYFDNKKSDQHYRLKLARGLQCKTIGRCRDLVRPHFGSHSWVIRPATICLRESAHKLRLDHYFTKSREDYELKRALRNPQMNGRHQTWDRFNQLNNSATTNAVALVEDRSMQKFSKPIFTELSRVGIRLDKYQPEPFTKPDFIIIGAQKAGTTAAIENLCLHKDVWMVNRESLITYNHNWPGDQIPSPSDLNREMHFFDIDQRWAYGADWYLRFFSPGRGHQAIGEKTPDYLATLKTHQRMFDLFPEIKLIALLRNPVERVYSNWNMFHQRSFSWDKNKLGDKNFTDAIQICLQYPFGTDPMLWRGCYAQQLEHLFQFYPRKQVHIAISERVYRNMDVEYNAMFKFLGLPEEGGLQFKHYHVRSKPDPARDFNLGMNDEVRTLLDEWYAPHNERLFELLGEKIPEWL